MTNAQRLAEIAARCGRATEGPWRVEPKGQSVMCSTVRGPDDREVVGFWAEDDAGVVLVPDADFIAHAREDVPWLLGLLGVAVTKGRGGAKITKHGRCWYFGGETPRCPECWAAASWITVIRKDGGATAEMNCAICGCEWTQTREECAE